MFEQIQVKIFHPLSDFLYKLLIGNEDFYGLKETFLLRIFVFGLIFNTLPFTRDFALMLSPLMLTIIGFYVIYPEVKKYDLKFIIFILIVFTLTITIEAIGTATGLVFGSYIYGDTLGWKIANVPVIIGLNWVVVILGTTYLASRLTKNKLGIAILAGLFAVFFDIFLEPNAMNLDYWNWENGIIPLQNYIAWFFITFAFSLVYSQFFKLRETTRAGWCMVYQTWFFAVMLVII